MNPGPIATILSSRLGRFLLSRPLIHEIHSASCRFGKRFPYAKQIPSLVIARRSPPAARRCPHGFHAAVAASCPEPTRSRPRGRISIRTRWQEREMAGSARSGPRKGRHRCPALPLPSSPGSVHGWGKQGPHAIAGRTAIHVTPMRICAMQDEASGTGEARHREHLSVRRNNGHIIAPLFHMPRKWTASLK